MNSHLHFKIENQASGRATACLYYYYYFFLFEKKKLIKKIIYF